MDFFDCNCSMGLPSGGARRPVETADELLAEMDRSGVARALVWHVAQRDYAVPAGNSLLAEAIAPHRDRLVGCWSLLPSQGDEFPPPDRMCEQMSAAGVKALRVWPDEHRFLLRREVFGPTLEVMVARSIPLILTVPGAVSWQACYDLLADFPDLVCILADTGLWGADRHFRPLVERYKGVHVELSTYWQDGGIEAFVQSYGPAQMLFGSGFPTWDYGGMMLALRHSDVSDDDKEAIASKNLERLLGE